MVAVTIQGALWNSPKAGKRVTMVTRWRQPAGFRVSVGRGWGVGQFGARSFTLVRVLGVHYFDVGEGEETPPSVHLPLPLATDVHPRHLDDVTDLGGSRVRQR